ncbi:serine hydrolase [Streptomyces sp. NC-S4]
MKAVTVAGGSSDDPKIEAETTVLEGESKPTAEPGADREADTGPKGGADAQDAAGSDGDADAETTARSEAEAVATEPKADADADTEPENEAAPKEQADAKPETETTARSEAEAVTTEPKAEADTEPENEAAPKEQADAKPETETTARSEAEAVTTEPKADAEAEDEATPEGQAGAEPEGATGSETGTEAEVKTRSRAETVTAKPKADADTAPEDEAAPKAQGGAKPHVEVDPEAVAAEPEGEPGPEAKGDAASDETMLIALPKAKPAGPDAPRKAPSWAREADPDPERTSQFVALKDVDLPAPTAPRAQPQAPGARSAAPAPATPLPPLDLLAELTNTPPPVETPRRTAVRRVKIWTPILLLLVGAGAGAQLMRPLPAPQLVAAEADRTIDGKFSVPWPAKGQGAVRVSGSGDIGTFGEQKPVPTASVAKVMTAYVILKGHPLRKSDPGPDITIDAKTVADGNADHESRVEGLTVGQKFSQQDVLKMLMIPSGNNAARLLARWDSGTDSEAAFVEKMNAAAKELGMTNTTYTDPSGLDSGTVSTAVDQLKLAEAVMKDEVFRSIVALPNASIKGLSTRLENNNILLTSQGLSIRGIKTGSSTPAGGTLMWAAYKSIDGKDQLILGTLMDQHADGPDEDGANSLKLVLANSKTIIEGVRTALASAPLIRKGDVVGHVDDGLGGRTPLVATKDLNVIGVPGQQMKLSLTRTGGAGELPHTAKDGSEVAVLTVGSGEGARSVPVAVKGALAEPSFGTRLTRGR